MDTRLLAQLAALPEMEATEMKALWKRLYQKPPPPFNRSNYIKRLAYRIQELAYGVDSRKLEKRLELYARQRMDQRCNAKPKRIMDRPITGTRLMREYCGEEHHVMVLAHGFEYRGKRYKSLSAIARSITGTQWSGPLFFGLKRS